MPEEYDTTPESSREPDRDRERTRQLQAERMAAMARLAAGVAHEINNPAGVLMLKLKFLLSIADAEKLSARAVATLEVAVEQTERIERIVERLVGFSQPDTGVPRRLATNEAVTRALQNRAWHGGHGRPVPVLDAGDDVPDLRADPADLERLLLQLVDNAAAAAGPEGHVRVATAAVDGGRAVEIAVDDDGPGIPADFVEHIFDPFFTTKRTGEGTGLGLAVVHNVVSALGGRIDVDTERGRGTTMRVRLPAKTP